MTTLAGINELFPQPEAATRQANSVEDMGSEAFLTLMVAQLKNQDPTKPLDNMDFMGQLAQFGTVSGIQDLNTGFGGLASALTGSQALQAANLVGRDVVTEGNVGLLRPVEGSGEEGDEPALALDATVAFNGNATSATLFVQDMTGRLVYSAALPPGVNSDFRVQWDGRDGSGAQLEAGQYRVSVEALVGGVSTTVPVYAHQRVDSVAIAAGSGEVALNLANGQTVGMNTIKSIL
ncbi:MAG: flagellar hook capping FlgD N-terminal domain-containing protein [Haliea sp.]|uniref:flagellar hook assembly protein FlgD n=1 Tax=Haliea sp. TaxID=1932666 RepID=UPI0032F08B9C